MERLRFCLNGQWVEETSVSPTTTLLRYLRDVKGLSGTKEGCAEGDCGACTVAVAGARPRREDVVARGELLPAAAADGAGQAAWCTVEALKDGARYHPAQEAMAHALGSQCGYCTPGVVMSLFEATYRPDLDAALEARRSALRQPLPLHRLPADSRRGAAGGRLVPVGPLRTKQLTQPAPSACS